ncbi:MAG TPA: pentapeptide repeat-containing protein [Chryseosolibacter sp.]|nr:pentapeptide repeat-containing protein [Chryseosolibacter sp.]
MNLYKEDEVFSAHNFSEERFPIGEYEQCTFVNCNFMDVDLSRCSFVDCRFEGCDLSGCRLDNTAFKTVHFDQCKLLGLRFDTCSKMLLSFTFSKSNLALCSFYQVKIKGTTFKDCSLKEADFTEADASGVVFEDCDLGRAIFDQTNLEKADLSTAFNFQIDPENANIKNARFSRNTIEGLLAKYSIRIE